MTRTSLSRQQLLRVRKRQEQRRQQLDTDQQSRSAKTGLIISHYGKTALLETPEGELIPCTLRRNMDALACGDRVIWEPSGDGQGVITALQPRSSLLQRPDIQGRLRPVAANIEQIAVIIAPEPEPSATLIDCYLVAIEAIDVNALIVMNKIDLLDDNERTAWQQRWAIYQHLGYPLIPTSTRQAGGIAALTAALTDRVSILLGQSGVGKSSLIKTLLPEQEIRIQALSATTGLGTHTTAVSTLYHLPAGGDLIDSPGVRSFEPHALDPARLAWSFREFRPFLAQCRFTNCTHTVEPRCAVLAAVDRGDIHPQRLHSYQMLYNGFQ